MNKDNKCYIGRVKYVLLNTSKTILYYQYLPNIHKEAIIRVLHARNANKTYHIKCEDKMRKILRYKR